MRQKLLFVTLALIFTCASLMAQTTPSAGNLALPQTTVSPKATATTPYKTRKAVPPLRPFSKLAVGGGISLMGINMQAAVNASRHLNIRGTGNFFNYTASNITVSNFALQGKVNFATAGASLDYYPFPTHGFRLSPGVLLYNGNQITASATGTAGSNISLNSIKYYSETANPLTMSAALGLNTYKQAFTITTGWGNMIPRKGGHWSFPFELGAAFTGTPSLNVGLSGFGCTSAADAADAGPSCVNMATNTTAQTNLTTQVNTWKNDLNDLKAYPIFSFGVSYAFGIR